MSEEDAALAALDAAIREHTATSGGPSLVSAWVLITEGVRDDSQQGHTVLNYGGPDGQSWAVTAGLLHWATLDHDRLG